MHAGYMKMFAEQNVHSYVQDKSQRYNCICGTQSKSLYVLFLFSGLIVVNYLYDYMW